MGARRLGSMAAVWLCALAGCGSLWVVPAQARIVHLFEGSFGSEGSGPGQFKQPVGVAVNDVTHNVYVVDSANNRVEEFNSSGSTLIGEFNGSGSPTGVFSVPRQIAVDNSGNPFDPSAGDVYVVDNGHNVVDKFSESGAYVGQLTGTTCEPAKEQEPGEVILCPKGGLVHPFEGLQGVAVDPSGTVWTLDEKTVENSTGHSKVGFFDSFSAGQPIEPLTARYTGFGGFLRPQFALDAEDNIYMIPGWAAKVNSSGEELINPFCGTFKEEAAHGVALDLALGQAFVDKRTSIDTCGLTGEPVETFGSGHLTSSLGVAVDASSGEPNSDTVYASDASADRVVIFAAVTLPTVSVVEPSEQQPRSVTLKGTVNPEGRPVTSCVFEYDTTPYTTAASHGTSVPCSPARVGSGSAPVAVSAHISGLTPETEYHYRLVAANAGGSSESGDQKLFTGPILGGEYATSVTASSATLNVPLDANGDDTHYYFEYGTSVSYGAFAPVAPPGADVGSLRGAQTISVHLQGLQASAVYHYRLVAEQSGEVFEEPDRTFTTQAAGANALTLPDGRAWELVSPANKHGALIGVAINLEDPRLGEQAAGDGGAIAYQSDEPISEGTAGRRLNAENLAMHGRHGWSSRDITAPKALPPNGDLEGDHVGSEVFYLFSPDLSRVAFEPGELYTSLVEGVSERTDYVRDNLNETYEPLVTASNVQPGTTITGDGSQREQMRIEAVTPDLTHVFLESSVAFTADAGATGFPRGNLYEWSAGQLQFIGEGVIGGGAGGFGAEISQHAVSNDGRWVVIRQGDTDKGAKYSVRDTVEGVTIPFGGSAPHFETMSADGSKVFFLETEGGGSHLDNEQGELYVFDPASGTKTDLTANHLEGEASAEVQNMVSASEDGSYVYFVATGVLAPGAKKGSDNLYVLHEENGQWTTAFIATLSSEDRPDWRPGDYSIKEADLRELESRVSPDGRYLAFMSNRSLTGYDNTDTVSGQRDEEVYLYDAASQRLVCASCNPTGARPIGVLNAGHGPAQSPLIDRIGAWSQSTPADHWLAGVLPPAWYGGGAIGSSQYAGYQPRYLFDDGRLFFNSPDALAAQDTNGVADTYEYEPPGAGSCTGGSATFSERSGGCVNLISSGQSASESVFSDASETGDDVFFITNSRLVAEDYDSAYDLYDAHVCSSGWACALVPVGSPQCTSGDSCKAAPSPQPEIFGPAPSATFSGVGNVRPSSSASAVKARGLTRTQRLARALRACRKKRSKRKRAVCERNARRRYGATRSGKSNASRKGGR